MARRRKHRFGTVELVYGPMTSGKSSKLAGLVRGAEERFAQETKTAVHLFKPPGNSDKSEGSSEESTENVLSRNRIKLSTKPKIVTCAHEILDNFKGKTNGKQHIIAIDEVQMFDAYIIDVSQELAKSGHYVLMSGLDTSFRGEPFPFSDYRATMDDLIESVDDVRRHVAEDAWCARCNNTATHTQRFCNGAAAPYWDKLIITKKEMTMRPGDRYEPRCSECFEMDRGTKDDYALIALLIARHRVIARNAIAQFSGVKNGFDDILQRMIEEKIATCDGDTFTYLKPRKK